MKADIEIFEGLELDKLMEELSAKRRKAAEGASELDITCEARFSGWFCTRARGHKGPHVATGTQNNIYAISLVEEN